MFIKQQLFCGEKKMSVNIAVKAPINKRNVSYWGPLSEQTAGLSPLSEVLKHFAFTQPQV